MTEGVFIVDANGRIVEWNNKMSEIFNVPENAVIGQSVVDIWWQQLPVAARIPDQLFRLQVAVKDMYLSALNGNIPKESNRLLLHLNGEATTFEMKCLKANLEHIFLLNKNNDQVPEAVSQNNEQIDDLTKLSNRAGFMKKGIEMLSQADKNPFVLLFIDMNRLKILNDIFGHVAGDELLAKFGQILKSHFRNDDLLARLGGDEFCVLLPNTPVSEANDLIARLIEVCGQNEIMGIPISCAVGKAISEGDEHKFTLQEMIHNADNEMYLIKQKYKADPNNSIVIPLKKIWLEKEDNRDQLLQRITKYAKKLGDAAALDKTWMNSLDDLVLLQQLSDVAVPDYILQYVGGLREDAWQIIRNRQFISHEIARSTTTYTHLAAPLLASRENWDGTGYPNQLDGENIPLVSRILYIVDSFCAMLENRPYRAAMTKEEALLHLMEESESKYDPELVKMFVNQIEHNDIENH
ncbi:MAG: diguanylate cyclase [bacterium]